MTTTLVRPRPFGPLTPSAPRDGFVDVLRVFAMVLVVLQHWLMPVIAYQDGQLRTGNALTIDHGWIVTWISQVMPLIFFAGGAAAAISLRRRRAQGTVPDSGWVADRVRRLAVPVLGLAAVWLPGPHLLVALGVPAEPVITAARLVGALLWFLAAYVLITMASPLMLRLADTWRGREVAVLALGAVAVDVLRFSTDASWLGYANVILVWGAVHQFGMHYGSGSLTAVRGRRALALATVGFAGTVLAVTFGPYSLSMIGMPGEAVSNMNPPAAVLLTLAATQLGLALWLRPTITRWAALPVVARGLDRFGRSAMTIYLWHTPALVLVAGVAVLGFGQQTPHPGSGAWVTQLPLWLALLSAVLFGLTRLAGPVERLPLPAARVAPTQVALASLLVASGLLGLTVHGFRPDLALPVVATVAIAAGVALVGSPLAWSSKVPTGRLSA